MRPILRYHGGKWNLARHIIAYLPPHRVYVEPYGGAASVLLQKPRSYSEIYNDLDGSVVNVFRMARDRGPELMEKLRLTPFSREEMVSAYQPGGGALEQARRTILRSFQGYGSDATKRLSGFRASSNRSGTTPAHDWKNYAEVFPEIIERLRGVAIERREALKIIRDHDTPETCFYVDPPYIHSTRSNSKEYAHEMTDADHRKLAAALQTVKGIVLLSGYSCPLYSKLYRKWRRVEIKTYAGGPPTGQRARREVVWMNFTPPGRLL